MMGTSSLIGAWLREFLPFVIEFFPRWFGIWLVCLVVLVFGFKAIRSNARSLVGRVDTVFSQWARRMRYKNAMSDPEGTERVGLTWFFRFWTNFASAPCLGFLAFAIPIWAYINYISRTPDLSLPLQELRNTLPWLLPTFCYYGSMGLSYVLKRVFRRARPLREKGAFGHRLKDGSFPSGHSLTAFSFWVPFIVTVSLLTHSLSLTSGFAVIALSIVGLTGLSRIYMAVHWPSDVLGGYIIGAVWTAIFLVTCTAVFAI
jgi:membrane-associated phospholipid phosphatase